MLYAQGTYMDGQNGKADKFLGTSGKGAMIEEGDAASSTISDGRRSLRNLVGIGTSSSKTSSLIDEGVERRLDAGDARRSLRNRLLRRAVQGGMTRRGMVSEHGKAAVRAADYKQAALAGSLQRKSGDTHRLSSSDRRPE